MQTAYKPDDLLTVTMTAVEWNQVMHFLGRAKFNAVAPLITKIHQQALAQAQGESPVGNGNGIDHTYNSGDPAHVPHR